MNDHDPSGAPVSGMPDPSIPAEPLVPATEAGPPATEALAAADPPGPAGPAGGAPDPVRTQNRIALFGTIGVVAVLAVGGAFLIGRGSATGGATASPGTALVPATPGANASTVPNASAVPGPSAPVVPTVPPSTGPDLPTDGNRLGSADAKVVIEYWADYQCPFCARFAQETLTQLIPRIADGTVAVVHRDFAFIGPESIDAAVAVACAERDGGYWTMHDALYAAQDGENQGAFARDRLGAIATGAGLDGAAIQACLDDRDALVGVLADTAEAARIGIESTPTAIVNGKRFLGVPDLGELNAAIDAAVAGATPDPPPSPRASTNPWSATRTDGYSAGDPAAPVTVDLWMDYQATDSGAVAKELNPELRTRLAAGTVQARLHDLALLDDESVVAATALRCVADQGGPTWFVSDILSVSAQGAGAGIYTPQNLLRFVAQLGLDVRAFDTCLADTAVAAAVREETAAGEAAGLTAGPVVIVSVDGSEVDRFIGPLDIAGLLAAIDAAVER